MQAADAGATQERGTASPPTVFPEKGAVLTGEDDRLPAVPLRTASFTRSRVLQSMLLLLV